MALSERSRSVLYQGLVTIVDEQAVQEMMSYFPARDVEEPVTKEFLRAEMSELRSEMNGLRAEMNSLRAEVRAELHTEIAAVRADMSQMEARLVDRMNRIVAWNVGTTIAFAAVLIAAVRF